MKKQFAIFATVAALTGAFLFSACGKKETVKQYAWLDVIQTSPEAPGLNVFLDSATKLNSFVLTLGANTGYQRVDPLQKIFNAYTYRLNAKDTLLFTTNISIKGSANYSLFIIDSLKKISTLLIEDDLHTPPTGKAYVRFLNLSPNGPRIDVANQGGSVVSWNIPFKEVRGFTELKAGVYNLEMRRTGSDTLVARMPPMVFNSGKVYTVYAKGFDSTTGKLAIASSLILNRP